MFKHMFIQEIYSRLFASIEHMLRTANVACHDYLGFYKVIVLLIIIDANRKLTVSGQPCCKSLISFCLFSCIMLKVRNIS